MRKALAERLKQGLAEGIEHARGEQTLTTRRVNVPADSGSTQSATIPKNILSLAGEYFVAAELSRWGFLASITYGSAKSVDIQVTNPANRRLVWIEAKTTQKLRGTKDGDDARWVVNATQLGDSVEGDPSASSEIGADFYVFVLIKPRADGRPRYFIATREEVLEGVKQSRERYNARRASKGKGPFEGKGVPGVTLKQLVALNYEDAWSKIVGCLEEARPQAA